MDEKNKKITTSDEGDLKKCIKERQEYLDGWQRARADAANERLYLLNEMDKKQQQGVSTAIVEIISVLDTIDIALSSTKGADQVGIEQIKKQFLKVLIKMGVKKMDLIGKKFDPAFHESVGFVEVEKETESDIIKYIERDGYSLDGKIIRIPKVGIGKIKGSSAK